MEDILSYGRIKVNTLKKSLTKALESVILWAMVGLVAQLDRATAF